MDHIPSLIFCGLSTTFSFDDDSEEGSSVMDFMNPLCCRDQGVETIFRPMTNEEFDVKDEWSPPLFRDKSLLSSPSSKLEEPPNKVSPHVSPTVDVVHYDHIPSPKQSNLDLTKSNDGKYDLLDPIPTDFLPPRHSFSRTFDEHEEQLDVSKARTINTPSPSETRVDGLKPTDVLCGRGMNTSIHPGNLAYKKVIKKHEMEYICSKRSAKPHIAMKILEELRRNSIRFVKREKDANDKFIWIDIGDQRAYEKVCQSLREGAPQLRRQMLSSQALQQRQDSSTPKSMSVTSSVRDGDEDKWTTKRSSSNNLPLYASDSIAGARYKGSYYYHYPCPAISYYPPASASSCWWQQ
ncbi:hypothetical protein IV203_003603 [Nitzschia inconspicua]|uniref:DUF6824 domain-containing protein n=1 Tax=Nitzschia inconspicua TaxID=303405 RepID=A0A9K3L2J5_9STRA|nr:hypothetical protein IV203_003603 [Nitzschia inconspicua]